MVNKKSLITRRTFLQTTAWASGSALILGSGCADDDDDKGNGTDDSGPGEDTETGTEQTTSIADYKIFSPGKIGNLELKNRLVRSATGECLVLNGEVTEKYLNVFSALASGGVGMLICGNAASNENDAVPLQLYAFDDAHIDAMKTVRDAVSKADPQCKLIGQIVHSGNALMGETRVGPSDISWPADSKEMKPLTVEEIGQVVEEFAQATRRFKEAGWDGVEIHGAHGYLLSSFLSSFTNNRTDQYGGSLQNRLRIVKEIMERARTLVGDDFPIMIKLNSSDSGAYVGGDVSGGIDTQLFVETATEIAKMGVDAIDVSGNNWIENDLDEVEEQSLFLDAAEKLDLNIPVILTGGNRSLEPLEGILNKGEVDFIAMARPLIREPDLPNKWLQEESNSAKCISCNQCFYNIAAGLRCHQEPDPEA